MVEPPTADWIRPIGGASGLRHEASFASRGVFCAPVEKEGGGRWRSAVSTQTQERRTHCPGTTRGERHSIPYYQRMLFSVARVPAIESRRMKCSTRVPHARGKSRATTGKSWGRGRRRRGGRRAEGVPQGVQQLKAEVQAGRREAREGGGVAAGVLACHGRGGGGGVAPAAEQRVLRVRLRRRHVPARPRDARRTMATRARAHAHAHAHARTRTRTRKHTQAHASTRKHTQRG